MTTNIASTLAGATASSARRGRGLLRTAGAIVGGLGLAGLAAGGAALAWGSVERTMPVLRRYDVPIKGNVPEVTILQIADLHLFAGQEFLLRFLSDVAASERFDMVLATGDNFGSVDAQDMVMDAYRPFLSYPGAFVLGSNDYYSPIPKRWSRYLSRSKPHPARVVPDLPYLPMVRRMRQAGWVDLSNASGTIHLPARSLHARRVRADVGGLGPDPRRAHARRPDRDSRSRCDHHELRYFAPVREGLEALEGS